MLVKNTAIMAAIDALGSPGPSLELFPSELRPLPVGEALTVMLETLCGLEWSLTEMLSHPQLLSMTITLGSLQLEGTGAMQIGSFMWVLVGLGVGVHGVGVGVEQVETIVGLHGVGVPEMLTMQCPSPLRPHW
jgi:hypothetical protein